MIIRTDEERENGRIAGRLLADILNDLVKRAVPGVTTAALDLVAEEKIRSGGAVPVFLNYRSAGSAYPFPAALCASVNDEVVHGIPREDKVLEEGDIISLDLGLSYQGFIVDAALTVPVGAASKEDMELIDVTRKALAAGLKTIHAGARVGDIGAAVEAVAHAHNLAVVEELGGHATGKALHEKPFIANVGEAGTGEVLPEGLVLAIEPIFARGKQDIVLDPDEWTYRTADSSHAAHFEQTIVVTKNGCEILTSF